MTATANAEVGEGPANWVVSFTNTKDLNAVQANTSNQQSSMIMHEPLQENDSGGNSITMPDKLDNFSDVADVISNR